jgi:CRISPR-associated exonuclease Cas4
MHETAPREMLPISSLNALEYCPRKFYYQVVQGETLVNDLVLEGQLAHQRVHQAGTEITGEEEITIRRLYLYSETLRLSGFADVIEERAGVLVPIEYKHGQQGDWPGDQIQICAQALCLEERQPGRPPIPYGYVSYLGSRRRVRVPFTPQLRARTREAIAEALRVAASGDIPPPLSGKLVARCPNCSLLPLCLPEEVRVLQAQKAKEPG